MLKCIITCLMLVATTIVHKASTAPPYDSTRAANTPLMQRQGPTRPLSSFFKNTYKTITQDGKYQPWTNLQFSGYVRPYFMYRTMDRLYEGMLPSNGTRTVTINGYEINNTQADGYQEPFFLLRLEGKPTTKTAFKLEYAFDHQFDGVVRDFSTGPVVGIKQPYNRRVSVYRVLQFQADAFTKHGSFRLIAGGGVNWYRLSPFTLWNYEYRDDMFERYPWEPENKAMNRYNSFYAVQNVARDVRWGNTGTQGFILEAKGLPKGFGAVLLYGKTDNSGGFQTYIERTPKNMASGRVDKSVGIHKLGVNYFSQFGYFNSTGQYKIDQNILTADARLNFDKIKIFAEAGAGRYIENGTLAPNGFAGYYGVTPTTDSASSYVNDWAPAVSVQADFDRALTVLPLSAHFYFVDKSVVNINSQVMNTANTHAQGSPANVNSSYDITTFRGVVTDVGQMANNRWGGGLKHEDTYGPFKILLAGSVTQEIENLYKTFSEAPYNVPNTSGAFKGYAQSFNTISFQHRANQFTRSRMGFYQNDFGPYKRNINIYRRIFEQIAITDSGSAGQSYKKGYNSVDFNWKYKINIFNRDFIISNYHNYSSVQDKISPIPLFTDKAFLRYYYTELNAFYALHPKVTLLGFASIERALGNNRTVLADAAGNMIQDRQIPVFRADGKPINQTGHGYGIGLDYDFASRAGIYIRHRWFDFNDTNFTLDHFKGQETQVEFKVFF